MAWSQKFRKSEISLDTGLRSNRILQFRTGNGSEGFRKNSTWSDMDIQTAIDHCSEMVNQSFFRHKPDRIKYLDRSTGLGSDRITQWKFWTGLRLQKSPICSTPMRISRSACVIAQCFLRNSIAKPNTFERLFYEN